MIQGLSSRKVKINAEIKEDSLTSSVIGTLLFFPVELIWTILSNACYDNSLPSNSGEILNYEFWPHWNSVNTNNKIYVEPDVFIEFENFNIIIEAKRWDKNQQLKKQWLAQYQSYKNEYELDDKEPKKVYYFALGGIRNTEKEHLSDEVFVYKIRWENLLREIENIKKSLDKSKYLLNNSNALIRIADCLISAFELHGFFTGKWLESLSPSLLNKKTASLKLINQWKI